MKCNVEKHVTGLGRVQVEIHAKVDFSLIKFYLKFLAKNRAVGLRGIAR